ncbi:MAG: transglycosylase SLT domain-containing protein [Chitinophagales bacterium]
MKKTLKRIATLTLILMGFTTVWAIAPAVHDTLTRAEVDPVIRSLDSVSFQLFTRDKFFATNDELDRAIHLSPDQLPHYTEAEMKQRMKAIPSAIQLDYNSDVQAFIDLFVYRRRELMSKLLANSQIYFPLFEETLDKKGMPDELKYLPIVESALNPTAVSCAGATGLWQLMLGTGKMMGLDANSYVDERRDPIKSTEAGTKYLQQLYAMYGDWPLALAAYNSGPGYVNKAIARAGGVKNFWAIKSMLPAETRSYVPTFIAVVYAMHYHRDYKIESAEPKRELYAVDTIMFPAKASLRHIANTIGMSVEELQFLNPSLKIGIVPPTEKGFPLNMPVNYFAQFEAKKEVLLNDPEMALQATTAEMYAHPQMVRVPRFVYYRVHRNDNINSIARRYGVSTADIKKWNHLRSAAVARGQNIKILTFPEVPSYQAPPVNLAKNDSASVKNENMDAVADESGASGSDTEVTEVKAPVAKAPVSPTAPIKQPSVRYYRVQSGDTLWSIVQKYRGLTVNKLRNDNRIGNSIQKGQVLKIVM